MSANSSSSSSREPVFLSKLSYTQQAERSQAGKMSLSLAIAALLNSSCNLRLWG